MTALARRDELEELRAERDWLRDQLAFEADENHVARLMAAHGLTETQARIFILLAKRPGHVFSQEFLESRLPLGGSFRAVQAHITGIRRRLGFGAVGTVWGVGYRITPGGAQLVAALAEEAA